MKNVTTPSAAICAAACVAICSATCAAICTATCAAICSAICAATCAAICSAVCAATCAAICSAVNISAYFFSVFECYDISKKIRCYFPPSLLFLINWPNSPHLHQLSSSVNRCFGLKLTAYAVSIKPVKPLF